MQTDLVPYSSIYIGLVFAVEAPSLDVAIERATEKVREEGELNVGGLAFVGVEVNLGRWRGDQNRILWLFKATID